MYLYYDKTRTLKTTIAHGEPIRQNSDVNIFVCLDYDFFNNIQILDEQKIKTSEFYASVTYENGKFGANNVSSSIPEFSPFEKINTSEMTYYLVNGEYYWTYQFKFGYKEISLYPGKIYFNISLIVDGKQYTFSTAELFVEARTGLPEVDESIAQTQYDEFVMNLNKLSNRVTIIEQTGGGSGLPSKLSDLTNTEWIFNESLDFSSLLGINENITFNLDFISNNNEWNQMCLYDGTDTIGHNLIQYVNTNTGQHVQCYLDYDGDGLPGWESEEKNNFKNIKISGGDSVTDNKLINWLYKNATLLTDFYSKDEIDLMLDEIEEKISQIESTSCDFKIATEQDIDKLFK